MRNRSYAVLLSTASTEYLLSLANLLFCCSIAVIKCLLKCASSFLCKGTAFVYMHIFAHIFYCRTIYRTLVLLIFNKTNLL